MGLVVDGEQPLAVDFGVDLGGGEAGVAQKLLDLPQVCAGRQQVRGERMPQRVVRPFGKAGSATIGSQKTLQFGLDPLADGSAILPIDIEPCIQSRLDGNNASRSGS